MQSWIGMLQTLKQYAGQHDHSHTGEDPLKIPNGTTSTNAILHKVVMENGAAMTGKDGRSTTFPTTTGTSVQPRNEVGRAATETSNTLVQMRPSAGEKSGEVTSGESSDNTRPRSQA